MTHHQRALDLARAVGSPLEQARALEGAGRCALARGDTARAGTELRQALEIYQRIGAAEATQLATDLTQLDTPPPMPASEYSETISEGLPEATHDEGGALLNADNRGHPDDSPSGITTPAKSLIRGERDPH